MTFSEKLALEAAAVAMFESFLRQQATERRGLGVQDWKGLTADDRTYWRVAALESIKETAA